MARRSRGCGCDTGLGWDVHDHGYLGWGSPALDLAIRAFSRAAHPYNTRRAGILARMRSLGLEVGVAARC